MSIIDLRNLELHNQRILIRADLNVPMRDGKISGDQRIIATLPTIDLCLKAGAKVMLMSHVGRPQEGKFLPQFSLMPVVKYLSDYYGQAIPLISDWVDRPFTVANEQLVVLENCRFNHGEMSNNEQLSRAMAQLCDIFVMDAFATSHRAQASTHGIAKFAPIACGGPLLIEELNAIKTAFKDPQSPIVALVGGSKVSTKLNILESLTEIVDHLIIGGGIANSFLLASGKPVGASLCEEGLIETAQSMIIEMQRRQANIPLATDVVVAKHTRTDAIPVIKPIQEVEEDDMILDLGPNTVAHLCGIIDKAATIIWNGPVGMFEIPGFDQGTRTIAEAIAASSAFSIAGGGDTLSAINSFNLADKISYISTGGGAFLELLEGKTLPAVDILEQRAKEHT